MWAWGVRLTRAARAQELLALGDHGALYAADADEAAVVALERAIWQVRRRAPHRSPSRHGRQAFEPAADARAPATRTPRVPPTPAAS